jgi:hypothetical protein
VVSSVVGITNPLEGGGGVCWHRCRSTPLTPPMNVLSPTLSRPSFSLLLFLVYLSHCMTQADVASRA